MILIKSASALSDYLEQQRKKERSVGFIPTMGALHQGHLSLVQAARQQGDLTVCSIFVNPTQFNDEKDFRHYPISIEQDIVLLEKGGCDVLFLPAVNEIYPQGLQQQKPYDLGYLGSVLEGAYRPGHFQGVCQVVEILLRIVNPQQLYLGQKDYQQCKIISLLIEQMGWSQHVKTIICPTLREQDGLAMSSRNRRLSAEVREQADGIYEALTHIKENLQPGALNGVLKEAAGKMQAKGFHIDYLAIAHADTLAIMDHYDGIQPMVALTAASIGGVRLIDNMLLNNANGSIS